MFSSDTIRAGRALPAAGLAFEGPTYNYDSILGGGAVLHPSGENATLDRALPHHGILERQIALEDWGSDWLLFRFDELFDYQGYEVIYCLIRARWYGCPVGSEFCPVFILTDNAGNALKDGARVSSDFQFVSWGEVSLDGAQPVVSADTPKPARR